MQRGDPLDDQHRRPADRVLPHDSPPPQRSGSAVPWPTAWRTSQSARRPVQCATAGAHRAGGCVEGSEPTGPAVLADDELDRFLAPAIRTQLEERYWRPIERATKVERFLDDDEFFADPGRHPASFSDHGVVHVRDVARRVVGLADQVRRRPAAVTLRRAAPVPPRQRRADGLPARHRHGRRQPRRAPGPPSVRRPHRARPRLRRPRR